MFNLGSNGPGTGGPGSDRPGTAGRGTARQDEKEDLYYGQLVIIIARWALILAGVVVTLWSAKSIGDVWAPTMLMGLLLMMNFYLHGRYVMDQPVNARLVYLSSAVDLVVITLLLLTWTLGMAPGLSSPWFIFLYPTLLAFALVFPPRITAAFAGAGILVYVASVLVGSGLPDLGGQKDLVERVITLSATAGLGTYFWRIQRRRRDAATHGSLLDEVSDLTGSFNARSERLAMHEARD